MAVLKLWSCLHSSSNSLLEGQSKHSSFSNSLCNMWLFNYIYVNYAMNISSQLERATLRNNVTMQSHRKGLYYLAFWTTRALTTYQRPTDRSNPVTNTRVLGDRNALCFRCYESKQSVVFLKKWVYSNKLKRFFKALTVVMSFLLTILVTWSSPCFVHPTSMLVQA